MLSDSSVQRTLVALVIMVSTKTLFASPGNVTSQSELTITRVSVLEGEVAEMPCDIRPPIQNDSLLILVWYKSGHPVYSYDTRVLRHSGTEAHWVDEQFAGRAFWHIQPSSGLTLQHVQARDRATYTCRVDFRASHPRNYEVTLDVIELPGKPIIFDEYGKNIINTAGPYQEGDSFKLICKVEGGNPTPRVQWFENDDVISLTTLRSTDYQANNESRTLALEVSNVTRRQATSMFTCSADNTILSLAQRTTVSIDLYLKPLTVEITSPSHALSVGKKSEFLCKTTGSRPPANISWWLGEMRINATTLHTISGELNGTESVLQWMPLKDHNYKVLTCRAEHPKMNYARIESNITLNVYYTPKATIDFGTDVIPTDIREGTDVSLVCKVDANPPAYKFTWIYNETLLQQNPSKGIVIGDSQLTLLNVSRNQAGQYACSASNVEGDGEETVLFMHVIYKPLCHWREIKKIGAALLVTTTLICEVDAYPPPNAFEWTLNSSIGSTKVDSDRYSIEGNKSRSVLTYAPVSDTDYGTMECRATNVAGQQMSPCVFTLMPASRPDVPSNCTVYNLTYDSMDILCVPGYEGGLLCVYVAEIWSSEGLVVNASNDAASWNLRRLGANKQLRVIVYAANVRGRSEYVSFNVTTHMKITTNESALNMTEWELSWTVGIILGAILAVAIIMCLALIATKVHRRSRDYNVNISTLKNQTIITPLKTGAQNTGEKNQDLIPLNKDTNKVPPDPPRYWDFTTQAQLKNSRFDHNLARIHPQTGTATTHTHYNGLKNDAIGMLVKDAKTPQREIVTTRTPLLSAHRESFV